MSGEAWELCPKCGDKFLTHGWVEGEYQRVYDLCEKCRPKQIVLIDDLPPGKVRTTSGNLIDRTDAAFAMTPDKNDNTIIRAMDGTIYQRLPSGAMKRLTRKKSERRKP